MVISNLIYLQKFMSEQDARKFAQTGHVDSPVRRTRPKLQENVDKSPARKGTPTTVIL